MPSVAGYSMKDKYTSLELIAVSEHLTKQKTEVLRVASDVQLADSLTKAAAAEMMTRFLQGQQVEV